MENTTNVDMTTQIVEQAVVEPAKPEVKVKKARPKFPGGYKKKQKAEAVTEVLTTPVALTTHSEVKA